MFAENTRTNTTDNTAVVPADLESLLDKRVDIECSFYFIAWNSPLSTIRQGLFV